MIQRKRGKPIVLREVLAKIVSCVNKFKEVGDIITQYDPAHAALPWAAVRLILQAAVSEQQIYDSMLEGLEHVADVIARYAWVETLYLHASSKMRLQLQDSIVKLYIAILEFLAKARRYYSKHTYQRVLKSLVQVDEQAVQKYIRAIAEKEEKVNNIARLVDAQYLREISKTMEGGFSSLLSRVDRISRQVAELQVESGKPKPPTDEEKKDMLKWLDPVSTFDDFHTAKTARQIGTCDWILRREEFQDWLNPEESSGVAKILWLHGKPGTGKTILSARIAEYLLGDRSRLFAFFFCFYGNDLKRDCNSIIKAWIAQIVKQDFDACNIALAVHREKEGNFANRFELWLIFRKINALARRQYYLIDGFDECDRNDDTFPKHGLVDAKTRFLTELIEAIDGTGTRVVIMSRPDAEVRDQMQAQMQRPGVTEFDWADYSITSDDTSADLKCFAQSMMNFRIPNRCVSRIPLTLSQLILGARKIFESTNLACISHMAVVYCILTSDHNVGCDADLRTLYRDLDLRQELAAEAADKADGMFLWIKLLYSQLSRSKSPPRLRKIITDTPSGLDQAYERDILNILGLEYEERVRAIAILRWTLFALRPLTIRQLSEALLVELRDDDDDSEDERMSRFGYGGQSNSDDNETDEENDHGSASTFLPLDEVPNFSEDDSFGNEFLKACGSLIELRGGDSFKAEDRTIHFVHFSVQEYLLKSTNINLPSLSELKFSDRSYSHGRLAQVYLQYLLYDDFKQTTSSTLEEFDKRRRKFAFLDYAGSTWGWHADRCRPLPNFILTLCKELLDPQNAKWLSYSEVVGGRANGSFQTFITQFRDSYPRPLFYASFWGIVDCMRFLVNERKEDVNHVGGLYGSPLKAAIAHGHEDAVSFLLENGANIYLDGGQYGTVVNTAAATGQVKILAMLLELKPDISLKGGWLGEPPLVAAHRSSRTSVENIVERLLDAGASCYATNKSGYTAGTNLQQLELSMCSKSSLTGKLILTAWTRKVGHR